MVSNSMQNQTKYIQSTNDHDDPHTNDHERLLLQANLLLTARVVSVVGHNQTRFIEGLLDRDGFIQHNKTHHNQTRFIWALLGRGGLGNQG